MVFGWILVILLTFPHEMLKVPASSFQATLNPFLGVPGHAPQLVLPYVGGKVLNNVLQFHDGGWLAPDHMGQALTPEGEIERIEVR